MLEKVEIEHIPATHAVYAAFFRDVANTTFLHSQLLARNPDFQYALIDAASVVSRNHVLAAVYKAVSSQIDGALKTPNVQSEVVYALSPTGNIAEAYRRYGITPDTKNVIVFKIVFPTETTPEPPSAEGIWAHLTEHVRGTPVALSNENIEKCTDMTRVRKYYKLNGAPALSGAIEDVPRKREVEVLVLGAMALRGL